MIKKFVIAAAFLLPCAGLAQDKPVMLPMHDGKIYFDNTYALDAGLKKEDLFNRAAGWIKGAFQGAEKSTPVTDEKKGEIAGTGVFRIIIGTSGHYYWLRFAVDIIVHNATYEIKVYDFYEKPIEPGVSNEYSKIEYRWWDYRQGKPWGPEDRPLFDGMDRNIDKMLASLQTAMTGGQ